MMSKFSILTKLLLSVMYGMFGYGGIVMILNALGKVPDPYQYGVSIFFIVAGFGSLIDQWRRKPTQVESPTSSR